MTFDELDWLEISAGDEEFLSKNYKVLMKITENKWTITGYFADCFSMMEEPITSDCHFMVRKKGKARQLHIQMIMKFPDGRLTKPHGVAETRALLDDVKKHHPHKDIYKRNEVEKLKENLEKSLPTNEGAKSKKGKI